MLLEYLVSSRTRREILKTLQAQSAPLSVRELSRKAGVSYSNGHREVFQLRRLRLLHTRSKGGSLLCSWNTKNPDARLLAALLHTSNATNTRPSNDEVLYWNLKHRGAPLLRPGSRGKELALEQTLAQALTLSRKEPDVAQVWPVVLAKNLHVVDLEELKTLARQLGQKKALGFMLSLSGMLLHDSRLTKFARGLQDKRVQATQDYFLLRRGKRARKLADEKTPPLAREWHFRMNMTLDQFKSHFNKFVPHR